MADPASVRIFAMAKKISTADATVLITGDTGTGKEILARYIHQHSHRRYHKYVSVNCAAIPDALLESELFGHERGAFTNALQRRIGKFEDASSGTILLDEISEMSCGLQAKLLRIIQEKEFCRLGGNEIIKTDARIIATSNKNLRRAVAEGTFRMDLFHRLSVIPMEIPRLTDRPLDIDALAHFFCYKYSNGTKTLSPQLLRAFRNYSWEGNVRELENVIHRAVILSTSRCIGCGDVQLMQEKSQDVLEFRTLKQIEHDTIMKTIDECSGNKSMVSRILGIPARTLRHKLNIYKKKAEF
ncbi:MAG: sigma-54 dependent transcriptional regulator [Holosporaceae bacterium]|nr:sigma-54 dependent transcriptional regulator [Holosporaceae bacterium]